jgi:hypothetical protein
VGAAAGDCYSYLPAVRLVRTTNAEIQSRKNNRTDYDVVINIVVPGVKT